MKLLRVMRREPKIEVFESVRLIMVKGPKIRIRVPKIARARPIFSNLLTFSRRKITPPRIVIIGPVATSIDASREDVMVNPRYKGIKVRGVPKKARMISSHQLLLNFGLEVKRKMGRKIVEAMKNLASKNSLGLTKLRLCFMIGAEKPQMQVLIRSRA